MPIVAAGKSSEYDFVFHPQDGATRWLERSVAAPQIAGMWELGDDIAGTVAKRGRLSRSCRSAPCPTVARWRWSPTPPG
ncbi:MAG: hypothetical protein QM771_11160 [Nitrospira sp.]